MADVSTRKALQIRAWYQFVLYCPSRNIFWESSLTNWRQSHRLDCLSFWSDANCRKHSIIRGSRFQLTQTAFPHTSNNRSLRHPHRIAWIYHRLRLRFRRISAYRRMWQGEEILRNTFWFTTNLIFSMFQRKSKKIWPMIGVFLILFVVIFAIGCTVNTRTWRFWLCFALIINGYLLAFLISLHNLLVDAGNRSRSVSNSESLVSVQLTPESIYPAPYFTRPTPATAPPSYNEIFVVWGTPNSLSK